MLVLQCFMGFFQLILLFLDGILISNSLFYERILGWNGVCIEPTEHHYQRLLKQRNCHKFDDVIFDEEKDVIFYVAPPCCDSLNGIKDLYDERHLKRIDRETEQYKYKKEDIKEIVKKARTMDSVLSEVGVKDIDFLSLDTEGSEFKILQSLDFTKYTFGLIHVEHNNIESIRSDIFNLLTNKNYTKIGGNNFDDYYKYNIRFS